MKVRQILPATLVLIVGVATCARLAGGKPPIHDITTDTNDPPQFVDVLPLRAGARNSAVYKGGRVAALQHAAYPDIAPVDLMIAPAAAFTKALAAANAMGWAIVASDSSAGRIEATATTRVFRFKDDVVIRIRPRDGGSRLDIRSVSRIGGSDLGKNASRIREFMLRLRESPAH
ncbi:MAG: DUF1499 domain-containing protein [Gemmatimonadota bacterium]|nr:DUF1499 domain-containing protein [Gemmatimonadota bacterium]